MSKLGSYLGDVKEEMNKVNWPSWDTLKSSTVVVIFVSFVMAFTIYAFDWLLTQAVGVIL